MKFTNNAKLPQGIVDAIVNAEYDTGGADYTPSILASPPQMRRLMQLFADKITVDVADEIWKLFGSSVHYILDKAQKPPLNHHALIVNTLKSHFVSTDNFHLDMMSEEAKKAQFNGEIGEFIVNILYSKPPDDFNNHRITEQRFFMDVAGFKVGAKPDWYHIIEQAVEDYKVTSVWKILKNDYRDWEFQLNVYRLILESNNLPVQNLQINAILKDWKKFEKGRDENYPEHAVVKVQIPMWNKLSTLTEIIQKIEEHELVRELDNPQDIFDARPCTPEEKWHGEDKYAVMKTGNKKASAVFDTSEEAWQYIQEHAGDAEYKIEVRLGEDKRCLEYCPARDFCAQYKFEHGNEVIVEVDSKKLEELNNLIPEEEKSKELEIPEKVEIIVAEKSEEKTKPEDNIEFLDNFFEKYHKNEGDLKSDDFNLDDFLKED